MKPVVFHTKTNRNYNKNHKSIGNRCEIHSIRYEIKWKLQKASKKSSGNRYEISSIRYEINKSIRSHYKLQKKTYEINRKSS